MNELEDMKIELSEEEERALVEISNLKGSIKEHDILKDFGEAAMQGVTDYLNSFIDTSEIISDLKNPGSVRRRDNSTVKFLHTSADPNNPNPTRTLEEAKTSPYSANAKKDNSAMSDKGRKRLEYYEEVYKQRLKTLSDHSGSLAKGVSSNQMALAGNESFKFGPTVDLYTSEEYKAMYEAAGRPDNPSQFIRQKNFAKYYSEKYKEFGFSSANQFKEWVNDNKFTIHETPDGMYLVPRDVHASESHTGEVSMLQNYVTGKISKEDLAKFEKETRIATVKYETAIRAQRAGKAVALGAVKVLIQQLATVVVTETYFEFSKRDDQVSFSGKMNNLVHSCANRIKKEIKPTLKKLGASAAGSVGMEVLNVINDFVLKTAKNIMKVIRSMIGSIIRALKVLFSKEHIWQEKVFEALKILSAGLVAALGFSLNEFISDALASTGVPILVVAAPFIGDVSSGLLASILSALVLMLFDSYKDRLDAQNKEAIIATREIQVTGYHIAIAGLEQLRTSVIVAKTGELVVEIVREMGNDAAAIDTSLTSIGAKLNDHNNTRIEKRIQATDSSNQQTANLLDELMNSNIE